MTFLCCSRNVLNQVIDPTVGQTIHRTNTTVDPQASRKQRNSSDQSMRALPVSLSNPSLREKQDTFETLLHSVALAPSMPSQASSASLQHLYLTHAGSGLVGDVEEIHIPLDPDDSQHRDEEVTFALKKPRHNEQLASNREQLKVEFQNETQLFKHFQQSVDSDLPEIEAIKTAFDLNSQTIKSSAVMVQAYEISHHRHPDDPCGIMPLVRSNGDVGDLLNDLLDTETVADQKPLVLRLLTGMRDISIMLAVYDACGIIHNDIKPENMAIETSGKGFILDHGAAEIAKDLSKKSLGGTVQYAAPERCKNGSGVHDCRADLFSLGRTLAEVFLGRQPMASVTEGGLHISYEIFEEIEESTDNVLGSEFIADIKHIVYPSKHNHQVGLTSTDPDKRPSAVEVAKLLQGYCDKLALSKPLGV